MVNRDGTPYDGYPGNSQLNMYRDYGYIPYTMGRTSNALDYAFDRTEGQRAELYVNHGNETNMRRLVI